jgi:hypothetical protein
MPRRKALGNLLQPVCVLNAPVTGSSIFVYFRNWSGELHQSAQGRLKSGFSQVGTLCPNAGSFSYIFFMEKATLLELKLHLRAMGYTHRYDISPLRGLADGFCVPVPPVGG